MALKRRPKPRKVAATPGAARRLSENEARFELAMRAINEGVYDWDIVRGTIDYSEGIYSVLKMPRSMKTLADWRARIHPEDLPAFSAAVVAHLKNETRRLEIDYRFRARDGSWRWARSHGIAQRDGRGRAIRMIGSTGDITELKRVEQALKESDERYELATRAATEGIYDWDLATGELYLSQQAKSFFGVGKRKLTPRDWNRRIHPEDYPGYRQAVAACFKGKTPQIEHEYRVRNAAGGYAWFLDRGVAVRDEKERVTRLVGALSDITERKLHEIELRRARDEAAEALERQTATAEVLRVISSSPSDLTPVYRAILEHIMRLCESHIGALFVRDGTLLSAAATLGMTPEMEQLLRQRSFRPGHSTPTRLAALERQVVQVPDLLADQAFAPTPRELYERESVRTVLSVPMLREGALVGVITTWRREVRPFDDKQVALIKTFADQAVMAIENVRLFNETREALERQTATSEILRVISSSPTDVQPVFDTIVRNAVSLCSSLFGVVFRFDGTLVHLAGTHGFSAQGLEQLRAKYPVSVEDRSVISSRAIRTRAIVNVEDVLIDPDYDRSHAAGVGGTRRLIAIPMLRDGDALGAIVVGWTQPGVTPREQLELLQTFADQAVIAIENVRLFTALAARNHDLTEALEQQTATAEVLRAISGSPADIQPILDTLVRAAARFCGAPDVGLLRLDGEVLRVGAACGPFAAAVASQPGGLHPVEIPVNRESVSGRAFVERRLVHVHDLAAEREDEYPVGRELQRRLGHRTMVAAPLLREGAALGVITLFRVEAKPFSDRQLALLQLFADQAVIAIENVRLFNETREALERQTATAEILRVIAQSPADVQPVFDALVEKAVQLCGAQTGMIFRREGDMMRLDAAYGAREAFVEYVRQHGVPLDRRTVTGRTGVEGRTVHVLDVQNDPEYSYGGQAIESYRSMLGVPLVREGEPIGTFSLWRHHVEAFTPRQIALIEVFAAQAVIAIENVRLFKELQQRTEALTRSVGQLTALGEVGQAISSTLDLETVLKTIVSRAVQLTGMNGGTIYEFDEPRGEFRLRAAENTPEEVAEAYRKMPIRLGEGIVGGAAAKREPMQVADIRDPGYQTRYRDLLLGQGYRAILAVPLLRDEQIIGALTVSRNEPGAFAPEVVELLKTFATQSGLAIQNARLFREIADKGKQLEVASHHKSQFLASMSHELRTPLNAILGFNEMILGDVYGEVTADMRAPLEQMQTSGKHLLRLINNVLDLAKIEAGRMELALADYSVQDTVASVRSTLQPLAAEKGLEFVASVPDDVPLAYGDGGRITQCLMNLAGNSLKFTKAGKVEISVAEKGGLLTYKVSDTGIGIPPDKVGSLFTEFKQTDATIASEYGGTGLGLSISKKFIEMHGGRIWVESELGKGSSFIFEVPLRVQGA